MREQVLQYIKENGVKQTFLAKKLGISRQRFNMYLQNKRELPDKMIDQLEKIINK